MLHQPLGVAQNDLTFSQAADTYTRLTVGDGLVSQIPALIVSTAAGMMVTKAGVSGSTEAALFRQMASEGRYQFAPFIVTLLSIVFTDLLTGILIGLGVSVVFILNSNLRRPVQK